MTLDLGQARKNHPGIRFRQANRNGRIYITISRKHGTYDSYMNMTSVLCSEFKEIRITSGSASEMTGVLPTMFEIIDKSK